ncbi:hypothetical protein PENSPDRAFT_18089 [Peniophora sp. CONT]|nr:hypothetical protein PENSPDRAFT_18089 [Peniophora sp. CONT]
MPRLRYSSARRFRAFWMQCCFDRSVVNSAQAHPCGILDINRRPVGAGGKDRRSYEVERSGGWILEVAGEVYETRSGVSLCTYTHTRRTVTTFDYSNCFDPRRGLVHDTPGDSYISSHSRAPRARVRRLIASRTPFARTENIDGG